MIMGGGGGKQPVDWKEYCVEFWKKELDKCMKSYIGRRDTSSVTPGVTHYDTLHPLSGNEWRVSERVTPGPVTEDGRDIT